MDIKLNEGHLAVAILWIVILLTVLLIIVNPFFVLWLIIVASALVIAVMITVATYESFQPDKYF